MGKKASVAASRAAAPATTAKSEKATKPTKAPAASAAFSLEEIGATAGAVWQQLSHGEPMTLAALKKSVGASPDLVCAGVGWLAREDKLEIVGNGRSTKFVLRGEG